MNRQHWTLLLLIGTLCCLSMAEKCEVSVKNRLGENKELRCICYIGPQDKKRDKDIYEVDKKTVVYKGNLSRGIPEDTIYYCKMHWKEIQLQKGEKQVQKIPNAQENIVWKGGYFTMYREVRDKFICSGDYGSDCRWIAITAGLYQFDQRVSSFVLRFEWDTLAPEQVDEEEGRRVSKGKQKEEQKTEN